MEAVYPYIIDAGLLLAFALVVFRTWHIGFARAVAGIVAWITAAVLALQFCAPLAQAVYTRFLEERVTELAVQEIGDTSGAVETVQITTDLLGKLPQSAVRAAQSVGVDMSALTEQANSFDASAENLAQQIETRVLEPVIVAALKVVAFLVILLVVSALVQVLLTPIGKALHKIPVIGTADRALGGVLGILKGAVAVAALAIILHVCGSMADGGFSRAVAMSRIIPLIESSPIANGFFKA